MLKLIGTIIAGFATLIPALLAFFARKYIVAVASIAAFVGITAVFIVCIKNLVDVINTLITLPVWMASIAWFVPVHFAALFSMIVSGRICRAAYDMLVEKIRLINTSS